MDSCPGFLFENAKMDPGSLVGSGPPQDYFEGKIKIVAISNGVLPWVYQIQ